MNLYVSNLAYTLTDEELRSEFAAYGTVASARVVLDRETGRSRGFGFVDMPNDAEARSAMQGLEGTNVAGRAMKIVEARPKEARPPRPPGGGGGGGGAPGREQRGGGGGGGGRERGRDWDDRGGRGGGGGGGGRRDWNRDRGGRGGGGGDDWD